MPKPVNASQRYLPGLDGLRALAVLAVIAYHEQFGWAQGGLLGVGVFFTLSGYLITDILLSQLAARGKIKLGSFWLGRARRSQKFPSPILPCAAHCPARMSVMR